jgi:uncharacterized protein YlxW (UPF0749 family)
VDERPPDGERERPYDRPDASMTLLRQVMERPLDPGYAAAAGNPRPRTRAGVALTAVLAVLAGAAFSIAVTSIRQPEKQAAAANRALIKQYQRGEDEVKRREAANAALRAANDRIQDQALGASAAALNAREQALGEEVGEVPVHGPGLRMTFDDAPGTDDPVGGDPRAQPGDGTGVVLDSDLQVVVNGLWAAGAEAIAINGHRLTALSAIRSAGAAILVDFRPLVPPYVVEAVGDPSGLQAQFAAGAAGPYVQSMRDNSNIRVDIRAEKRVTLPGAGQLVLRSAGPSPPAAPPSPASTRR